ncbi:MAG: hypothetical protein FWF95_03645 [Syntrophorhabdaceae bacterium]|nr:hypothetical protein [Syntrophorhabdaceae bacterium]
MPIYEYICKKCGAITERIHGMNETPRVKCEECGGASERKISSGAVIFKGSGFYATDYGKKSQLPAPEKGQTAGKKKGASAPAMSTRPLPKLSTDPD